MACNPMMPASCAVTAGQAAVSAGVRTVGDAFAEAMRDGATWVVKTTVGWWIDVPAMNLDTSPAGRIRGYVMWLAILVAIGGVIWQGIVMAISRRPEPVFTVARGLFTVLLWTAVGIAGPAAALRAGDSFSDWVFTQAAGNHAADRLVGLAGLTSVSSPGAVIFLGQIMMIVGLVQAVLMMFREAAVVILAGVVVLAAAGSLMGATRPWLTKVIGWMLALIAYKPAAALVYATALTLAGNSNDPRGVVVGLSMMVLAIVALPVLMRLFTWTTGAVTGSGGGMAALAGTTAAALHAAAALSSTPGSRASRHAAQLRQDLNRPNAGADPATSTAAPSVAPAGGAAPTPPGSPPPGGGTAQGAAGTAAKATAGPWLAAAGAAADAVKTVADSGRKAADAMNPEDKP